MNPKSSGVLLHPTSLSNPYVIGDLGPAANTFVDFMHQSQQRWWQMLPIGPTGMENSPYDGPSAFAGNPLLISPERLYEQGFLEARDIWPLAPWHVEKINYTAAVRIKSRWLHKAFVRFYATKPRDALLAFEAFIQREAFWLDDYALYLALKTQQGTANWTQWSEALRTRQPETLKRAKQTLTADIRYHQFIQWQFALQWQQLRSYCQQKHVQLIGDIPLFVAHQSAEVWAHPEMFKLDVHGNPLVVAGVPPDCFSATGQLWNVPVYCWEALEQQNYAWWIARVHKMLERFDRIRLDHFIGFVRTYEIPTGADTAIHGQYAPGGGLKFFEALGAALGVQPFIAEDLGSRTAEVDALRHQLHIPGMYVLQFDLEANLHANMSLDSHYTENAVIYTGTHDNDTTLGWYQSRSPDQRQALQTYLQTNDENFTWSAIRMAFASSVETVIIPMQDLLNLSSKSRMNLPGTAHNNWGWRMKKTALTPTLIEKLGTLTQSCGRVWSQQDDA